MRNYGDFIPFIQRINGELNDDYSSGKIAIKEIKNCKKETHWMWYIFPQLDGLGQSYMSKYYGLKDIKEAKLYINHPITGTFLLKITKLVYNCLEYNTISQIFGKIDKHKFISCMELFYNATLDSNKNEIFKKCLKKI